MLDAGKHHAALTLRAVAVRSEVAMVRAENKRQACDAPRWIRRGARHSQSPMNAEGGR